MKDRYIIDFFDPIERVAVRISGRELKEYIKSKKTEESDLKLVTSIQELNNRIDDIEKRIATPEISWTKKEITAWMDDPKHKVGYDSNDTKQELLDKIES